MNSLRPAIILILSLCGAAAASAPSDPNAKKIYDHDYEWLSHFPANFIASNIRGASDSQYAERRQAALDLLREKHDITTVPDLMDELQRNSFLSAEICELLGTWHARKALPLLTEVAADAHRPKDVRKKAQDAVQLLNKPIAEVPAPSRPSY
jgi:hypothetical protein